jgi:8-amino-7-oxononanoate synthase
VIEPETLQQVDRTYVRAGGRKLSYFSGCDYFRLSSHPQVTRALLVGLRKFGLSVAASRLTTGNHPLYGKLEKRLARFFGVDSALLVSSGYVGNLAVAQGLAGQFSHVIIDQAAHPSLKDAAELFGCSVLEFPHRSLRDLADAVKRCGPGAGLLLLTDGMFSRDGAVAPLKQYLQVLPADAQVLVDDAHGAGVLGKEGHGTVELSGVNPRRIIQTITLSKAFGTYGGAVLGSSNLRAKILARSRVVIGSTPLPLPIANAALEALRILETGAGLRSALSRNVSRVRNALQEVGMGLPEHPGPIIAVRPTEPAASRKINRALRQAGIYPPFIVYPGGPPDGYFRFVISSEHSERQLQNLINVLTTIPELLLPVL